MSIKGCNYIPEEWIYNKLEDENSPLHLGIELEIDEGGESEEMANFIEEKLGKNNCYIGHECSLSKGLEIVTHPCSLKYHKQLPYKELFEELINKGYKSQETFTCGFHIHIDRSYLGKNASKIDFNLSKLLYLIEKFWGNVVVVARRDENRYNQRYRHRFNENESIFNILKDAKCLIHDSEGKYMCVNLIHENSIELRMFKGTLEYESFIATLEFVSNLVDVAINTPLDYIESVTFKTIINYGNTEYLKDYYNDRVNRTLNVVLKN